MSLVISLIYSKNNNGHKTVPWGTPDMTGNQEDWAPFIIAPLHHVIRSTELLHHTSECYLPYHIIFV